MLLLYENILGYSFFKCKNNYLKKINQLKHKEENVNYKNIYKKIAFVDFAPFVSVRHAFQNVIQLNDGNCSPYLLKFTIKNLENTSETVLGVCDFKLAASIRKITYKKQVETYVVVEIIRIIRKYYEKFTNKTIVHNLIKAQSDVAYLFCQSKIKFIPFKNDNILAQSNFLMEQMDSDMNILTTISKEWYTWHFPELAKLLKDNCMYLSAIKFVGNKNKLDITKLPELGLIVVCNRLAKKIFRKAKTSTGSCMLRIDLFILKNICSYALLVNKFKEKLSMYLKKKLSKIAPNLTALLGEMMAAKLISHTGSLRNLAKLSASTVQLLGTEDNFFQKLKIKKNISTCGLLFNFNFLSKIKQYQRNKISKYLANKSVMAARIDYFSTIRTRLYGKLYRKQIMNTIRNESPR